MSAACGEVSMMPVCLAGAANWVVAHAGAGATTVPMAMKMTSARVSVCLGIGLGAL